MALPQVWRTALDQGRIAHAPGESLVIAAVSDDGGSIIADSYRDGRRDVVWLHGGRRTVVLRLADPDHQLFGASFDGRWLVFSVWDRPELNTSWTMYAWDSRGGAAPRVLGRASGPGVFPYPIVFHGRAFWTLALQPWTAEAHMTDLATGRDTVIATGWLNHPFRFGSVAVWAQMSTADTAVRLTAVDIVTGEPVDLPVELRTSLSRPLFTNGDADTFVWSTDDLTMLRARRIGDADAVTIIEHAPPGQSMQWPRVGGPLVTWDNGSAQFVADLRSGSYAQLTPEFGAVELSGDALVVSYAPTGKSSHPVLDSTLIRPSRLPRLPGCA